MSVFTKVLLGVVGVFVGLVLVVFITGAVSGDAERAMAEADAELSKFKEAEKLAAGWTYRKQYDEMRDETTYAAIVRSNTGVPLWQPDLVVYELPDGNHVAGMKGQFDTAAERPLCHSKVSAKFDDGPVKEYRCATSGAGIGIYDTFYEDLLKSKTAIIETNTNFGTRSQFKFNTANLKLPEG
ncbi:hypothetical protein [Croceicoccus gelatinilyticus]|uniref:hypothetical protein n=1 Tax=Croceicoccus gelatinilyticus TaxID=2835536 RepID=UPI001BCB9F54|nr:hypothetical protein [Croceicoccus gelatinilyticus]MBS7671749.1 hypothetical protein [Croceicoccus gelatinilyticus]